MLSKTVRNPSLEIRSAIDKQAAGIPIEGASGTNTSVHAGCFTDDYKMNLFRDIESLPTYCSTGLASSMLAARLSWFFNFFGPSVTLDSACSSSMMAFDYAVQGLQNGDTEMVRIHAFC
jgi:acyl transferase domain-containing protein